MLSEHKSIRNDEVNIGKRKKPAKTILIGCKCLITNKFGVLVWIWIFFLSLMCANKRFTLEYCR